MYLRDDRPEILKDQKLQIRFLIVMGIIIGGIIFIVLRDNWLINSDPVLIKMPITERKINYKRQGTLFIDYKVRGKGVYRAVASVSFSENGVNEYFLPGDSVYVVYYKKDPSKNNVLVDDYRLKEFVEKHKGKFPEYEGR